MVIPDDVLAATTQRYGTREPIRSEIEERIRHRPLMEVDSQERVAMRLHHIARTRTAALTGEAQPVRDPIAFERIIGNNDLMGVAYLDLGSRAAGAVGRVQVRSRTGRLQAYGTGFLIGPRLLLTNNHVLSDAAGAAASRVEFNFQDGPDGLPLATATFALDPAVCFVTDPHLDFTLVAVQERAADGADLTLYGYCPLIAAQGKVILGECLNIIQHPNGEPKQLALRENTLIDRLEDFLHYRTDTAPGSSGSPVFNDQWEVVALHHSGVPRRDGDGRLLAKDGSPWTAAMGEQRIDWIANEGVRVSRIVEHVQALALPAGAARLWNAALSPAERPAAGSAFVPPGEAAATRPGTTVRVDADGSATWTVPLQVTVRLGEPQWPAHPPAAPPPPTGDLPPSPPAEPPEGDADLRAALDAVEAGRRRPYYQAEADQAAAAAYYAGLPEGLDRSDLYQWLHELLERTHTTRPAYKPSRELYPWIDLQPNRTLRSIYSTREFTPEELIREDLRVDQERAARLESLRAAEAGLGGEALAAVVADLEAALPYNCEHVVPQSWFERDEPMRGDLHHLFACEANCNSFRGNTPYFDFADFNEVVRVDCGKRMPERFEPNAGKGAVARATLYFLLRYPGTINRTAREYREERLRILLGWHGQFPVTEYERHRNAAIFARQGNRNPLIDHPEWAERIDFARGLG